MNALHDALALIERDAASDFHTTDLSGDLSPVTSAVRRARFARATATVGAGLAVVVGGVWAVNNLSDGVDADPAASVQPSQGGPTPDPNTPIVEAPGIASFSMTTSTTLPQMVSVLAAYYGLGVEETQAALDAAGPVVDAGIVGWIPPGDYNLADYDSPADFAQAGVDARIAQLTALGVTESQWHEVLTVASLVETAVPLKSDFPNIAQVIQNRLAADMPLELDAPLLFATASEGPLVTQEMTWDDSLYNTYRWKGLPPGPIESPSLEALDAALHPAEGLWLFFVTVDPETGTTVFSSTMEEQVAAVTQLQEWYDAHES